MGLGATAERVWGTTERDTHTHLHHCTQVPIVNLRERQAAAVRELLQLLLLLLLQLLLPLFLASPILSSCVCVCVCVSERERERERERARERERESFLKRRVKDRHPNPHKTNGTPSARTGWRVKRPTGRRQRGVTLLLRKKAQR